jgi:hypothetical protein
VARFIPPAIYVRILEIRWVKPLVLGFFCTYKCAPTISSALKEFGQKKGYILLITKFIGTSPNFNDASPNIEILKLI